MSVEKPFKFNLPAEIRKSSDGEWVVEGVASTASRDRQGEVILQDGIDTTPIDEGRAFFNWDHQKGPDNILGPIDSYRRDDGRFIVKGRLFKNHSKAKAVHEIMSSLSKNDRGRMGMSVEGKILERDKDGKTIKRCQINAVALTMNPVNQDSFANLAKSLNAVQEVDFNTDQPDAEGATKEPTFTMDEVMQFVKKALSVGTGYADKPAGELSGGDALAQEDLDKKKKEAEEKEEEKALDKEEKKKKIKRMDKKMYKSQMVEILNKLQELYPTSSRVELWEAVKDRLNKRFTD